jgi:hypothetical protein
MVIKGQQQRRKAGCDNRRQSNANPQRVILAFACVLVGPSIAGSVDNSLPGVGTFAYTGSPVVTSVPQAMVVAVR